MDPSCPAAVTVSATGILPLPAKVLQNLKSSPSYENACYKSRSGSEVSHSVKVSAKLRYKQRRVRDKERKKNSRKLHTGGQVHADIALERVTERRQPKTLSKEEVDRILALTCASSTESSLPTQFSGCTQARQVTDRTQHKIQTISDAQAKHLMSRSSMERRPTDWKNP